VIEISHVSKTLGGLPVLRDVSLTLPAGGLTAIIGSNGAGKSTLLSIMARLSPPDSGRVTVGGLDVATTPSEVLSRRLAILRQENHIAPRLTVGELVAFGRYPHAKGHLTAIDKAKIEEALAHVEMDAFAARFLDELSGGQRQRAFVAMVLAQDTEYLLLDEPLNNLDMKHSAEMMRLLRRATDSLGKTVVVVIHDINFASRYADRIVAMREGRVVAFGPPADVVSSTAIRDVFGIDMPVMDVSGTPVALYFL
jgi:iron complex transport system ATP-binding protein